MSEIARFYQQRIAEHGAGYQAMWGDEEANRWKAFERFQIVEEKDLEPTDMLLDLGCGIGLLKEHLENIGLRGHYIGVDVVPEFLQQVQIRKDASTVNANFYTDLDALPQSDWLAIFGSINKKWLLGLGDTDDVEPVYAWLEKCYARSRKGIYLSCFTDRATKPKPANVHLSPLLLLERLGRSVGAYRIRHDTSFYEFTMMVRK